MKHALILPIVFLLAACAGSAARVNVQLPALQANWANLREAVVRQLAVEPDAAAEASMVGADAALEFGDAAKVLAVDWASIKRAVESDLARQLSVGEIGTLGAESRRGVLAEFLADLKLYTRTGQ